MSGREHDALLGERSNSAGEEPKIDTKRLLIRDLFKNLYSTRLAIAGQAGLIISIAYIYYHIFSNPLILFSGHPIFNLGGIFILGEFILLVQPTPRSAQLKKTGGQVHGILNTISTLLFGTGLFFIFYNKSLHDAPHITTWHATFGLISYSLLFLNMLLGVAQFWTPRLVFGSEGKGKAAYKYHRILGYLTFSTVVLTVWLAIASDFNANVLHLKSYVLIPGFTVFLFALFSRLQPQKLKWW